MSGHVDNMRRLLNHHDPYVARQGRQLVKASPDPSIRALLNTSRAAPRSKTPPAGPGGQRMAPRDSGARHCGAGAGKGSRPGDFDFTHLLDTAIPEPKPLPDPNRDHARAAAILALPEAKKHPAAAARLAASPGVSVQAARDVMGTIEPAAARRVNAAAGPFVAEMLRVRGMVDGQTHIAAHRGPELTRHDRANAAAARRERAA